MPAYEGDPNLITPGVFGFIAIAVVALATVLLGIDLTRRIRRTTYRAQIQEQIAAEQQAAAAGTSGSVDLPSSASASDASTTPPQQ
jgi:hypothetical protein